MKKLFALIAGIVFAWSTPAAAKMLVAVSIAPQAYFLKQIAGDRVDALVMVPPGADAHTYEPKPRQLAELGKASLYFGIGMDFENAWLPRFKAANPNMVVVRTDAGIEKMPMVAHEDEDDHDHGKHADGKKGAEHHEEGHHHEAGEPDPHVWLSPSLAKVLAASMRDALAKADPQGAPDYASCDTLAAGIQQRFADLPPGEHKFMVFHPSWGYFARDFGLTQEPIEALGREPGPKALAALVREAKKDGVKVVFVQPQMSTRQAQAIAQAIGGEVAALDPLAEDWAANLENAAKALRKGMAGQTEPK